MNDDRFQILNPYDNTKVFFTHDELACKRTGVVLLATGFAEHLAHLRAVFGDPMSPNSCCRSAAHNRAEKGHPRSLHVYDEPHHPIDGTAAIDIRSQGIQYNERLIRAALPLGWSVGVAKSFIHLDRRDLAGLQPGGVFGY